LSEHRPSIAILGGTGALGTGLARRWAGAGHAILIGSREAAKAEAAASAVLDLLPGADISGLANLAAAEAAEIVVLTVPFAHHDAIVDEIAPVVEGKILVDATVPLVPPKVSVVQLPEGGSVARATQERLGDGVRVVSAFQTVAAAHLADTGHTMDSDVLVCGNDAEARSAVIELVEAAGLRGWHAGRIENSTVSEALTSVMIFLNRRYKIDGAGIRITGEPQAE
jgi:NADPH-dependent F420 reductase